MKRGRPPHLVDLFSGAGGFTRGFHEVGFTSLIAVDVDEAAASSYVSNFPTALVLVEDVREVSCDLIRKLLNGVEVDVLIGSPPCEPFTGSNPNRMSDPLDRLYKDPQGQLVLEFIRILSCLEPKAFVMENVPAIMEGDLRSALKEEFGRVGYEVRFNVLKAEDYGTPSRRTRVFISNLTLNPRRSGGKVVVWDVLKDLPPPSHEPLLPNHEPPPNLSKSKLKRAVRVGWGSSMVKYEGAEGRRLPNLIRLHPYRVAPTVLGSSRFLHPFEDRLLTVREQARLMGFPDHHVFLGGKEQQYNQVGEAVPPTLAKAIAEELIKFLGG